MLGGRRPEVRLVSSFLTRRSAAIRGAFFFGGGEKADR